MDRRVAEPPGRWITVLGGTGLPPGPGYGRGELAGSVDPADDLAQPIPGVAEPVIVVYGAELG